MMFSKTTRAVYIGALILCLGAGRAEGQTPFFKTISGTTGDFATLVDFATPVGTGTARTTMVRVVTNAPPAGISFQVVPAPGPSGQTRPPLVEFCSANSTVSTCAVPGQPAGSSWTINDTAAGGTPTPVASAVFAEVLADAVASGYTMYRITIQYDDAYNFAAAETWHLKVVQTATSYEYFGFAGTSDAQVTRGKMQVPDTVDFGEVQQGVQANYAPVRSVPVRNVGTAQLTITGGSLPSAQDFARVAAGFQPVLPGGQLQSDFAMGNGLWYSASPMALGDRIATFTVASASETGTGRLKVHGISLLAHFLIDISGSMSWEPAGCPTWPTTNCTPAETSTRLWLAKQAAKQTNNWIKVFSDGNAYEGLTTFPGFTNGQDGQVIVPTDVASNSSGNIQVSFGTGVSGGLQPVWNGTPMESGIVTAHTDVSRIPNAPDLRKTIVLLTDGQENSGHALHQISSLSGDKIRVYTVAVGVPGSGEVDPTVLNDLASGTGGQAFVSGNASEPFDLKGAFKNVAIQWLGLTPVVDPEGLIRAGQTRTHDVCLDSSVEGVSFVVDWNRQVPDGIAVTLHTPKGETITPTSSGLAFAKDNTFAMYTIRGNRVRGGQAAGTWTMDLAGGSGLPTTTDTRYSYTVVVQTPIKTTASIVTTPPTGTTPPTDTLPPGTGPVVTGVPTTFTVTVTGAPGGSMGNVSAMLYYTMPTSSFGTFLATNAVDPRWVAPVAVPPQAAAMRAGGAGGVTPPQRDLARLEELSVRARKAQALARFADKRFVDEGAVDSIPLYDDGTHGDKTPGDGIFTTQLPLARYEGVYKYFFKLENVNPAPGACVVRQSAFAQYVGTHLTATLLAKQVKLAALDSTAFFDAGVWRAANVAPPEGYERKLVRLTPQDDQKNYWGPGYAGQVEFAFTDAEPIGDVIDNWDGSYLQVVELRKGAHAQVAVTAGRVTTRPVPLTPGFPVPWWVILLALVIVVAIMVWRWTRRQPA